MKLHDVAWKLNSVFTNEKIMKVFLGKEYLIMSLQRDFGIYCVNAFSIVQACRVLSKKTCKHKLLLEYCNQTVTLLPASCDWRYECLMSMNIDIDLLTPS